MKQRRFLASTQLYNEKTAPTVSPNGKNKVRYKSQIYTSRNTQKFKNLIEDNEYMKVKKKPQETFQEAQNWKGFSLNCNKLGKA